FTGGAKSGSTSVRSKRRYMNRAHHAGTRHLGKSGSTGGASALRKTEGCKWTVTSGTPRTSRATRAPNARDEATTTVSPGTWRDASAWYSGGTKRTVP